MSINPSPITPDPQHCPLCGANNQCAMERERTTGQQQPPCWCIQQTFGVDVLARIPEAARGKACLCPTCACD